MTGMHETFDHTADLGLRVVAADLDTLFAEAATALFSAIIEDVAAVRPFDRFDLEVDGSERELLFFDWLRELLYQFEAEHRVFGRFEVHVRADALTGSAWGEHFDPDRHLPNHEVKAITYHGLRVEQTADGWLAEVIVDI